MPTVIYAQAGASVSMRLTARKVAVDGSDGDLFAVNGVRTKRILDPAGVALAGAMPAWFVEEGGRYVAHWDTDGLAPGDYQHELEIGVAFNSVTATTETRVRKDIVIRLEDWGSP